MVIYTLSLHDALPIYDHQVTTSSYQSALWFLESQGVECIETSKLTTEQICVHVLRDRKSTRLNSSHLGISYAVFCLKKKRARCQLVRSMRLHAPRSSCDLSPR